MKTKGAQTHQEIRDAVGTRCGLYPDAYFRKIDQARAYPEDFVNALTQAGWLAALISQAYGGPGQSEPSLTSSCP